MVKSVYLIYNRNTEEFRFRDNDIWYSRKSICPRMNINLKEIYRYLNKLVRKKDNISYISFTVDNINYSIELVQRRREIL